MVNPTLQLGPLTIRWYGLLLVSGAFVGAYVAALEAQRRGENPDHAWNILTPALIAGIIGARLYHVFSTPAGCTATVMGCGWPWYSQHPEYIVQVWRGGLGIYGGIAGGLLVILGYVWWNGLNLCRWLDFAAPALLIGQAIGRWGNFVNQELYGPPTTLPWGIPIDTAHRLSQYAQLPPETRFHPLFLYESLWNLIGFGLLLLISRRGQRWLKEGDLALLYVLWYPLGRLWIEALRPDAWRLAGLPTAQLISLALIVIAIGGLMVRHWRSTPPQEPGHARPPTH